MKIWSKLSALFILIPLIVFGCQKTFNTESDISGENFNTAYVKNWYYTSFAKSQEFASYNRIANGRKTPDWSKGKYRSVGKMEIMEFPFLKEKSTINIIGVKSLSSADKKRIAEASLKRIVFIRNSSHEIYVRELDYVPEWSFLKNNFYDISNKTLSAKDNLFTGLITTKKWDGSTLSIRKLINGHIKSTIILNKTTQSIPNMSVGNTAPPNYVCEMEEVCEMAEVCTWSEGPPGGYGYDLEVVVYSCTWGQVCTQQEVCEWEEAEEEPTCDYNLSEPCECQLFGINCSGGGGGGGGSIPPYQLTVNDIRVVNQLAAEDAESDNIYTNTSCQGTKRAGNINFTGTKEHWLIQLDYIAKNPLYGEREYAIPFSSPTGITGYADIVNTSLREIFEIKPNNPTGFTQGIAEVTNYVIKANLHCPNTPGPLPPTVPWVKGEIYLKTVLPCANPIQYLVAQKTASGVIGYSYESRQNHPTPPPIVVPATSWQQLKDLVERLKNNIADANRIIAEFMHDHPELVTYLKGAAVGAAVAIVVGTILEDIATAGVGILDDVASFALAYKIVRFAWAL